MSQAALLLDVQDLHVHFPVYAGVLQRRVADIKAVDGVSFTLYRGETLGLVGESGCGKTTVGRAIINVLRHVSPDVRLKGRFSTIPIMANRLIYSHCQPSR